MKTLVHLMMVKFSDSFYKNTLGRFILAILADFVKLLNLECPSILAILASFLKSLNLSVA